MDSNKNINIQWYDLDCTLFKTNAMWWLIDKQAPENFIIKITPHEGSTILGGYHIKDGYKINYNGVDGWLSEAIWTKIQRKKVIKSENIGISWREFTDEVMINQQAENVEFYLHHIEHLKDSKDQINLLTARGNKIAHKILLDKLQSELDALNISISNSVFVNDPICVQIVGDTGRKKAQIMLQNIVGYEIEEEQFVPKQMESFKHSYFYDDEDRNIEVALEMNQILNHLLSNTQQWLKEMIENKIKTVEPVLYLNKITSNRLNPFEKSEVKIKILD